jgi:hypothetical protein
MGSWKLSNNGIKELLKILSLLKLRNKSCIKVGVNFGRPTMWQVNHLQGIWIWIQANMGSWKFHGNGVKGSFDAIVRECLVPHYFLRYWYVTSMLQRILHPHAFFVCLSIFVDLFISLHLHCCATVLKSFSSWWRIGMMTLWACLL